MLNDFRLWTGRRNWKLILKSHLPAIVIFFVMSWAFMGRSLTQCSTTVIGSVGGDHLSGIIALMNNGTRPYGGHSVATNYPFGESLNQPQLATNATLMVPTWVLSKIVGPICSWNLMVLAGYMLSALSMYAFIMWLLKRRSVAIFAALAVAFTPYHYFKTHGHLSYIHSELFILIFWSFLALWKKPSRKLGMVFGALISLLFYTDGYFPLIGGSMVAAILTYALPVILIEARRKNKKFYDDARFKSLVVGAVTTALLLVPILAVKLYYGNVIGSNLAAVRGGTLIGVKTYGSQFFDFFLPSQTHPLEPIKSLVVDYRNTHIYSNNGEYHLYLGFSVIILALYATIVLYRRKKKSVNEVWLSTTMKVSSLVFIFSLLLSSIPLIHLFGLTIPMPSLIGAALTGYWRVYARLYLVINVAATTMAAIGLFLLMQHIRKPTRKLVTVALICLFLVIEMLPINPFNRSDEYSVNDANETYIWLGGKKDINSLAAYPLSGSLYTSSYFADQLVHKKPLLNSYTSRYPELLLHRSLTGFNDGQTLGALRTLGINHLLLYQIPDSADRRTEQLYGSFGARVVRVDPSVAKLKYVLVPGPGYSIPVINKDSQISCREPLEQLTTINIRALEQATASAIPVHFDVKGQPGQIVIFSSQSGKIAELSFSKKGQVISVDTTLKDASQVISQFTVSDPKFGYPEVCNLTTY